jgi:hypothetical protein
MQVFAGYALELTHTRVAAPVVIQRNLGSNVHAENLTKRYLPINLTQYKWVCERSEKFGGPKVSADWAIRMADCKDRNRRAFARGRIADSES